MSDYTTLTAMLLDLSEPKLRRLRDGTRDELQRLSQELRFLEDVLARKQGAKERAEVIGPESANGRANDLPRSDLYAYVVEYGKAVKPGPLSRFLATKGVVRRPEAVRNGLNRLVADKKLVRLPDKSYAVAGKHGGGTKNEAGSPVGAGASFEASELQP